jgi:CHAT domain-containing protein
LMMELNVSYVPSATVYTLLRGTVKPADHDGVVRGLGYSGAAQQLPPLTYYKDELEGIASTIANVELFMDDQATESRLVDIGEADVIHMAAHGRFDSLNPLSSFIALSPDPESDGLLEVREVYQLSLQDRNPLIVLSACELAVSQVNPGDELEGMTRAFLLTGARGVIASMWPVDDYITSELMQAFYANRASGMTNVQALTAAKRTIYENYGDTYLWAGFVLIGLED